MFSIVINLEDYYEITDLSKIKRGDMLLTYHDKFIKINYCPTETTQKFIKILKEKVYRAYKITPKGNKIKE